MPARRFWVQLYATGLGFLALLVFLALDYRFLAEHSLLLFCGLVALLIYVLVDGVRAGGSTALDLARRVQPAAVGVRPADAGADPRDVLRREPARRAQLRRPRSSPALFFVVPFLLIAKQPDLGTAVTLIPVCFGIAYLAGLRAAAHRGRARSRRCCWRRSRGRSR